MKNSDLDLSLTLEEAQLLADMTDAFLGHIEDEGAIRLLEAIRAKLGLPGGSGNDEDGHDEGEAAAIEEYNDGVFWKELIERLASRQMMASYGTDRIEAMTDADFQEAYAKTEGPIREEIEARGMGGISLRGRTE